MKDFIAFLNIALSNRGREREKLFEFLKQGNADKIFTSEFRYLYERKDVPDLTPFVKAIFPNGTSKLFFSYAYKPFIASQSISYYPIEAKKKDTKKKKRRGFLDVLKGATIGGMFGPAGRVIGATTKGWAMRWKAGKGLIVNTPLKKTKISKTQLLIGGAVATGVILALTPAGPLVLSSLGTIASKAGALGLTALSSVASFSKKSGKSLLESAKMLGISPDLLKKEFNEFIQKDKSSYENLVEALTTEGAKEAEPEKSPLLFLADISPFIIMSGLGIGSIFLLTKFLKKK